MFSNSKAAQRPQRRYRLSERKEDPASAARRTEAGRKEAETHHYNEADLMTAEGIFRRSMYASGMFNLAYPRFHHSKSLHACVREISVGGCLGGWFDICYAHDSNAFFFEF